MYDRGAMVWPSRHDKLQERARDHLLLHFSRNRPYAGGEHELLVLDRGEGSYVYDTRGRRYLDGLSCLYCAQLGYSYGAEMAAAAAREAERLCFNSNWSTAHPAELAPAGLERTFFTGGGADSVEAAWKLVRQFHVANGEPQRTKAIARRTAYHGATLGALALTGVPAFKEPFGAPAIDVTHVSNTNAFRHEESEAELCRLLIDELSRVAGGA